MGNGKQFIQGLNANRISDNVLGLGEVAEPEAK